MKPTERRKTVSMLTFWGIGASAAEGLGSVQVRPRHPRVTSKGSVRTRRDCGVITRDELLSICARAKDDIVGLLARKEDSSRKFLEVRFESVDPEKSRSGIIDPARLREFFAQLPARVKITRIYDNIGKPNIIIDLAAKVTGEEEVILLRRRPRARKNTAAAG